MRGQRRAGFIETAFPNTKDPPPPGTPGRLSVSTGTTEDSSSPAPQTGPRVALRDTLSPAAQKKARGLWGPSGAEKQPHTWTAWISG